MHVRGITHIHSTYSYDGSLTLAEIKELCQARDIAFACMAEHTDEMTPATFTAFVDECRALSDESFLFIPGLEIPYREAHIALFGCTEWVGQQAVDAAALRAAASTAAMTVLAHPVRNHFTLDDVMKETIDGVEVWNQQYDGKRTVRPRSVQLLSWLRKERPELRATAGLDLHRVEHMGEPTITMDIRDLTEPFVLQALSAGRYTFADQRFAGRGDMSMTMRDRLESVLSRVVIASGKYANKQLAAIGVSLPKSVKRWVRRFV